MRVLVTGGAGYLGSRVVPKLAARGHSVRVLDLGHIPLGYLPEGTEVDLVRRDLRELSRDPDLVSNLFDDVDCVVHLAALSSDTLAETNPDLTAEVNVKATEILAAESKQRGTRFIFSSSGALYGHGQERSDENSKIAPLSEYAHSKAESERMLIEQSDEPWRPVILRNGSLFGYAPRMRFDLVVNVFALLSTTRNEVKVFGSGAHWRPFVHVADCADAIVFFAEHSGPQHLIYNVSHQDLRVIDLVDIFKAINPKLRVVEVEVDDDERSYQLDTSRLEKEGFNTRMDVETGSAELVEAIVNGAIADPESLYLRKPKWIEELELGPLR